MNCEKCGDRGFTEKEHGLIRIFCNCEKGKEIQAEITGEVEAEAGVAEVMAFHGITETPQTVSAGANNDSNSGARPDNPNLGSGDTGQPEQPKKPKAKKKARKRAS